MKKTSKIKGITAKQLQSTSPWVGTTAFEDSGAAFGEDYWSAERLYAAAQDQGCRPYKLPIKHMDLSASMGNWGGTRICDVAYDARRIMRANTDYPILLGPLGGILDGYHRVAKAVALGHDFIWAIRLEELPPADDEV